MDNITHTLVGSLVGATIARTVSARKSQLPPDTRRTLCVALMAVGGNLPDLDLLYSAATASKLNYLLQHRGHTHTLVGVFIFAALMFAVGELWLRRQRIKPTQSDRLALACVALLGPLLHLAMDFTNSYGVHPFWPIYNGWLYGDSVFIVEPLFWAAAAPLVFVLQSRAARVLVALVLAAGLALSFFSGLVPALFAVVLMIVTLAMLAIGRYTQQRTALLTGIAVWLTTTAVFIIAQRVAASDIEAHAARSFPSARMLDHVLTPMPVNPVCWEIILVQSEGERYALRTAVLSLAPQLISAAACPAADFAAKITVPITQIDIASSSAVQWRGEIVLSIAQLKKFAADYCQARDLLRFARAPFFATYEDKPILGDLRYDREPQPGFAEVELGKAACPSFVPPWIAPRADLLR